MDERAVVAGEGEVHTHFGQLGGGSGEDGRLSVLAARELDTFPLGEGAELGEDLRVAGGKTAGVEGIGLGVGSGELAVEALKRPGLQIRGLESDLSLGEGGGAGVGCGVPGEGELDSQIQVDEQQQTSALA